MAEKDEKGTAERKGVDPELRFKYLGFEVKPGKIGDLFKSDSEKESWIKRVLDKRKSGIRLREECSLTEPRVAPYERIVLTVTSVLIILSLFLPWFSGYKEIEVKPAVTSESQVGTDSSSSQVQVSQKDDKGFASISMVKKKVEIRREFQSVSALGALASIGNMGGKAFSSGFILMLTAFLFIIYMLLCLGLAGYTLYALYGIKGDADSMALQLKKILRLNWIPVAVWGFCLLISVAGADYSFDPTGMVKQLGRSYGTASYLGLLTYGFYLSLAAFIMNAVKAVEI